MNYAQTLEFLFSQLPAYHRVGKAAYKNNLDNAILLDNYSGNPHKQFKCIHIAGTNGKGSVSHMIASILQEAGYKTGLYTSPHLKDFRERIKINGMMIPEEKVISYVDNNKEYLNVIKPSFFEMTVAMAFDYFAKSNVDIAVVEVGLGGRLDSTNIITPILSVITNIGHDHMDILGNTLSKVAAEKAGIIKKSVPVIISETQSETRDVFISHALASGSAITFADQNFTCTMEESDRVTGDRRYVIGDLEKGKTIGGVTVLGGDYQSKNLVAVYQIFRSLNGILQFSGEDINKGIYNVILNTGFSGRWQILSHTPLTIADTGHNKEGLEYVINQLARIPNTGLHIIIGFVNDKDISSVLPLLPANALYYFTRAAVPRALDEKVLRLRAEKHGLHGESYHDVRSAREAASGNALQTDLIFIGGSTFIVADALLSDELTGK